jgi:hypothetical protein
VSEDGSVSTTRLRFVPTESDHGRFLTCRAENPHLPSNNGVEDQWKIEVQCELTCKCSNSFWAGRGITQSVYFDVSSVSNVSIFSLCSRNCLIIGDKLSWVRASKVLMLCETTLPWSCFNSSFSRSSSVQILVWAFSALHSLLPYRKESLPIYSAPATGFQLRGGGAFKPKFHCKVKSCSRQKMREKAVQYGAYTCWSNS